MSRSLEDELRAAASPLAHLRNVPVGSFGFPVVRDEYTHWMEEQRAWRETCAFADQSHHMTDLWVSGPDARALLSELAVNSFARFDVGQAKQLVVCNPDGYVIGDGILFHLAAGEFVLVGPPQAPNWIQYHAETGDYDVSIERDDTSGVREGPPTNFRYQIQGPEAIDVMSAVVDGSLPDLSFFTFGTASIDGHEVRLLRHGMAGEPGFEFWGPWEDADAVESAVLDAGADHGIRRLGAKSYGSSSVVSGWVGMPLAAIYTGDDMREYREWLDARSLEAKYSIAGSFHGDDVTDYYLRPSELGYDHLVSFDHDFVGRDALEDDTADRTLVTLEWNSEDVVDVYASLFEDGPHARFVDMPVPWRSAAHYDEVHKDGDLVGLSTWAAYTVNERAMLSLSTIDVEHADPGTDVTLVWGEADPSNPSIESHDPREIRATVAPVPYTEDRR